MASELEAILAESSSDEEGISPTLSFPGLSVDEILREEEETEERVDDGFEVDELDDEYNANDLALLQQILREDEEGDDDDTLLMSGDFLNDAESSLSYGSGGPHQSTTSSTPSATRSTRWIAPPRTLAASFTF